MLSILQRDKEPTYKKLYTMKEIDRNEKNKLKNLEIKMSLKILIYNR